MMNAVTDMTSLLADVFEGTTSDPIPLGWHQTFIDNVQNDPSAVCLTLIGDFEFFFQYDVSEYFNFGIIHVLNQLTYHIYMM